MLRFAAARAVSLEGRAHGRTFLAGAEHGVYYSQRILTEPIDSQRQDNIVILDICTIGPTIVRYGAKLDW